MRLDFGAKIPSVMCIRLIARIGYRFPDMIRNCLHSAKATERACQGQHDYLAARAAELVFDFASIDEEEQIQHCKSGDNCGRRESVLRQDHHGQDKRRDQSKEPETKGRPQECRCRMAGRNRAGIQKMKFQHVFLVVLPFPDLADLEEALFVERELSKGTVDTVRDRVLPAYVRWFNRLIGNVIANVDVLGIHRGVASMRYWLD